MGAGLVALIRGALVAVLTGMAVAAAIRLRVRRRAVPPQTGGWRELRDDELADDIPPGSEPGNDGPAGDGQSDTGPAGDDPGNSEPTGDEASAERG